jgi:hypothetical protein
MGARRTSLGAGREDDIGPPNPRLYKGLRGPQGEIVGYPLAAAPVPAYFPDVPWRIHTVLTGADRQQSVAPKPSRHPAQSLDADRAVKMMELHGKAGQYEAIVTDLQGQLDAIKEQFAGAISTISAQKTLIDALRLKAAA